MAPVVGERRTPEFPNVQQLFNCSNRFLGLETYMGSSGIFSWQVTGVRSGPAFR